MAAFTPPTPFTNKEKITIMNTKPSLLTTLLTAACLLASTTASAIDSTWKGGSAGDWNVTGNWTAGIPQTADDTARINDTATIDIPSSIILKLLVVNAPVILDVASGATLAFSNSGGDVIQAEQNLTINATGSGAVTFSMSGTTGADYANIRPAAGKILTINAPVIANGLSGIELNSAGTLVLTNPGNTFTGYTRTSTANGTVQFTHPDALGRLAARLEANPSTFAYIGPGAATQTLPIAIPAANSTFQNAGSGTLTLAGGIAPETAGAKTLTFSTPNAQDIHVTGAISNGPGQLSIIHTGTGTLILGGTVSHTGTTTLRANCRLIGNAIGANGNYAIEQGATLTLGNGGIINGAISVNTGCTLAADGGTFQNRTLNLAAVSTLDLNPGGAADFTATFPTNCNFNGSGIRMLLPTAANTSTVKIPNLIRANGATLDILTDAATLGTARNTLLIPSFTPGPLPGWLTINGQPATYNASTGVHADTPTTTDTTVTALGPATIQNAPGTAFTINDPGTGGGIGIADDPTTIFSLTQNHADNAANVSLGGKTLAANAVTITDGSADLTITGGTLTVPTALTPPTGPAAAAPGITANAIAWYDFSDTARLTIENDRVTGIANKITSRTDLNAAVPEGSVGPLHIPNAVAGLGFARSDDTMQPRKLTSSGNSGITNKTPRTAFIVAARSPVSRNTFYALYLGPDGGSNQDFAICERPEQTSYSTKGNDLNYPTPSPIGLNVLTFITGLNSDPNAGAGYRNGELVGTMTFALATIDSPINILHRPNTANAASGPGDIAEVLIFDTTLSDIDRAAVEAYLMHKWQVAPVATRPETLLALQNDNTAAALTVPDVTDAFGATLTLAKSGDGDVIIDGAAAYSGPTQIREGSLTFRIPAGVTNTLAAPVSGSGALVKDGPGGLALSQANPYAGGTAISAGTLITGINGTLGTGPVTIDGTGALDLALALTTAHTIDNPITVRGTGPDTLGALRNANQRNEQLNAFRSVTLDGNTAVYAGTRLDVRAGMFDFGGHSLTINGGARFSIVSSSISNVTSAVNIHAANGEMNFEASDFQGSSANTASAATGSGINLHDMSAPMLWTLQLADNAHLRASSGNMNTNVNRWAGPVQLQGGTARLNAVAGGSSAITGAIGGPGGLLKEGPGWFWLLNPANTYAGATTVTQGNLYAVSPGSLGTPAALTVSDGGALIARAASGTSPDGWTKPQIEAIANTTVFTAPSTSLGIDTLYADFDYTGDFPYIGLRKLGPYTLTLTGAATNLGPVNVYNGTLDLTGTGDHNLHGHTANIGMEPNALAILNLANASLNTDDPGYSRSGPSLGIGWAGNGRGILNIGENAAARGRLLIGNESTSAGAVYQTAGTVTNTGGRANDAAIGVSGHGYYRLDGGELAIKGFTQLGRNAGSHGILDQRGGEISLAPGAVPPEGDTGGYYDGTLAVRAGTGHFLLSGGTFNLNTHSLQLGEWSGDDGTGILTLEGSAQATGITQIVLANRNGNAQASVNLNGGTLTLDNFQKGGNNAAGNNAQAAINFNGGRLSLPNLIGGGESSLVRTGANNTPATLNVHANGAVIDNAASYVIDQPLSAPANPGVISVTATAGAGYIAPPAVTITGGGGFGATAVAEISGIGGTVTGIRVITPGTGYTSTPTVTLHGGGATTAATATAALGASSSGGLTKLGPGALRLAAPATYTGPTVVSNGTLRLNGSNQALAMSSAITLAGGTLDLAGASLTNLHPVTLQSGRLINGTLSAGAFTKTGTGTATLGVTPEPASAEAIHETFIRSLDPLIWYDPSDPSTVAVTDGRITAIRSKGSKPGMDAAIGYSNDGAALTAPLFATGTLSYAVSGLPMIDIDDNNRGLASGENTDITGTADRTTVGIFARHNDSAGPIFGFGGNNAERILWEFGDRHNGLVLGTYGGNNDLTLSPVNPAKQVNVFIGANTAPNATAAWRTGKAPNHLAITLGGTLNTSNSRLLIGQRPGVKGRADFRGQIGEMLVFTRKLSDTEREELQRRLIQKWMTPQTSPAQDSGASPVTVAGGTLRLAPTADAIARLDPHVWYDPSDTNNITLTDGRVTRLRNKGSGGPDLDAVPGATAQVANAPGLATGPASYAASGLPMIKIDANEAGLGTSANLGISGADLRTVAAILSRDSTTTAAFLCFGVPNTGQMWEVGDREDSSRVVIGGISADYDLIIESQNPARQANVVITALTAPDTSEVWRTGSGQNYKTFTAKGNYNTAESRFIIGNRIRDTKGSAARGQIGEILIFKRALPEADRADLEAYLAAKWTNPNGAADPFAGATFDIAPGATLDLNGNRANITVTGTGTVTGGTLGAGFIISPAGDAAIGELTLSGITLGSGAQYNLTVNGTAADRLFIDGDLTNLTIIPATANEVTGGTYIIATGAITGKPTLSGEFPSKYKLRMSGADLLLTSDGGTLFLLK